MSSILAFSLFRLSSYFIFPVCRSRGYLKPRKSRAKNYILLSFQNLRHKYNINNFITSSNGQTVSCKHEASNGSHSALQDRGQQKVTPNQSFIKTSPPEQSWYSVELQFITVHLSSWKLYFHNFINILMVLKSR